MALTKTQSGASSYGRLQTELQHEEQKGLSMVGEKRFKSLVKWKCQNSERQRIELWLLRGKSKYDVPSVVQTFICKMNDSEDENYKMAATDAKSKTE